MAFEDLLAPEPFLMHLGLEIISLSPGHATLRLPLHTHLTNHVHSLHAGAQYTLGEATATAVAASLVLEHIEDYNLLTKTANITYSRPANGSLQATGRLSEEEQREALQALSAGERATCHIAVAITDETGQAVTALMVTTVILPRKV